MKVVLQRVSRASVSVDGAITGSIGIGLLVLLGVARGDTPEHADELALRIVRLRIFEDAAGKMNLDVAQAGGGILIVPNFTLYGDCSRGRRPSFDAAERPEPARLLYEHFVASVRATAIPVATGVFQASMEVSLVNSGPVTLVLESASLQ